MTLDSHGQPENAGLHARLRIDRSIHEMLGLIKGVLVDGVVSEREANALKSWLTANPDAATVWPGYVLAARLERIFTDGVVDDEERTDLVDLLQATVGGDRIQIGGVNPATELPVDVPAPDLVFSGQIYLFTGKFVYGTRAKCQKEVLARGGLCANHVTRDVNYLIIGCIGSRDWIHTSWGRKIEAVVRLRERGIHVPVVREEDWTQQLTRRAS